MKRKIILLTLIPLLLGGCNIPVNGSGSDPIDPPGPSDFIHVEKVEIRVSKTIIEVGERLPYEVIVTPENADELDYQISSSDTSVLIVTEDYISGKAIGKATITATSFDNNVKGSIEIEVVETPPVIDPTVDVTNINLTVEKEEIYVGDFLSYQVEVLPENATDKSYTVTSNNTYALVSFGNNQMLGVGGGESLITIKSKSNPNIYATKLITVTAKPIPDTSKGFPLDGYTLDWSDEFNGDSLSDDWEAMIGNGKRYGVRGWGNAELQYYKEENAIVNDGVLHIIAKKETTEDEDEGTFNYTSSRLRTKGRVSTTYGYIEARMKLPAGSGMWPAFWMLPETNYQNRGWPTSGEIDIMEARGRVLNMYGSTLHSANQNGYDIYHGDEYQLDDNNNITQWHCYGCEWLEDKFNFYLDGELWFTCGANLYQNNNTNYTAFGTSAPFNKDFHILLNLAVGGNYDGGNRPDSTFESAEMLVDFVRIYTK